MAYGGDAVGRDPESGLAVFAWPAIAGEEATVQVTSRSKNLMRGLVAELHVVAPERTAPPCPYFGSCGGCQWQHISYDAQLEPK
jgi:23S rRNA (uracil1939-C5)-methyltransferase